MQYQCYLEKAEIIIETDQLMLTSDLETLLYFFLIRWELKKSYKIEGGRHVALKVQNSKQKTYIVNDEKL